MSVCLVHGPPLMCDSVSYVLKNTMQIKDDFLIYSDVETNSCLNVLSGRDTQDCRMFFQYTSLANSTGNRLKSRNDLIREYFFASYNYAEIQTILLHQHGIILSLRQLHRILRHLGLRRNSTVQREVARQAIKHELEGCGSCLGYRSMTRRLLTKHGLSVSRALVADLLRELDSDGVAMRAMHRFSRRVYINKGPNYLIHVDGYVKLKPFGFPIHGAICGFSRRVLWLKVANTNNNPNVVATHFMEYVNEIKGVPRCIRIDNGTENVMIEDVQMAFRWDDLDEMAAEKSVLRGSSHSNQRIERWWRSNKEGGCQFWIDLFKDLVDSGNLSLSNELHIECMRFCFMDVLQKELNLVRMEWNQHPVRSCRNESPAGKPDILFHLPGLYDSVDYKIEVRQEDIDAVQQYCQVEFSYGCSEEYSVVFTRCLNELGKPAPSTADEALEQFMILKETLDL